MPPSNCSNSRRRYIRSGPCLFCGMRVTFTATCTAWEWQGWGIKINDNPFFNNTHVLFYPKKYSTGAWLVKNRFTLTRALVLAIFSINYRHLPLEWATTPNQEEVKPSENLMTSCTMSMAGASTNGCYSSTPVASQCSSHMSSLPRCSSYMSRLTSDAPRHRLEMG